ncbi:MAG: hypothetical protein K8E66_10870, partial [Phycisphaerales bacterium]|nr:hypothetical protein [Phycisphaerales bacterium]
MNTTDLLNRVMDAAGAPGRSHRAELEAISPGPEEVLACLDEIRGLVVRDLDGALRALDVIALLSEALGSDAIRARLGSVRGHALNYATRFEEAIDEATRAVEIAGLIGDEVEAARAWMVLVHAYAKQGRLDNALRSALEAERAFTEAGELGLAV